MIRMFNGIEHWYALATIAYLIAAVLFILALKGLSSPVSALRGNLYGMVGMLIAVVTTVLTFAAAVSVGWWVALPCLLL